VTSYTRAGGGQACTDAGPGRQLDPVSILLKLPETLCQPMLRRLINSGFGSVQVRESHRDPVAPTDPPYAVVEAQGHSPSAGDCRPVPAPERVDSGLLHWSANHLIHPSSPFSAHADTTPNNSPCCIDPQAVPRLAFEYGPASASSPIWPVIHPGIPCLTCA